MLLLHPTPSRATHVTTDLSPKKRHVTLKVLLEVTGWRILKCGFVSLSIEIERAIAVDAGIHILPKSEDDYKNIIYLFKEGKVPHHTFPFPFEKNIQVVVRWSPPEQVIRERLKQKGYSPHHIIRLKGNGGMPTHLAVVILRLVRPRKYSMNINCCA
nr:unnamed protein product [Callosobruchus chinensis]